MPQEAQQPLDHKANDTVNSTLASECDDPECDYELHRTHALGLFMTTSPSKEKRHQSISRCIKAAEGLEWVEKLKLVAEMKLEHICSKFSVLLSLSSSPLPLTNSELVVRF